MRVSPIHLSARIIAYCAGCDKELYVFNNDHVLGQRFFCMENREKHIAAVVKDEAGKFWLKVEQHLRDYEKTWYKVARKIVGKSPLIKANIGRLLLLIILFSIIFLIKSFNTDPHFYFLSIISYVISIILSVFFIIDILIVNTSIVFISRFPAHPLRTVIYLFISLISMTICFSIFYKILEIKFDNEILSCISAIYFSFTTISTLGYSDIYPNTGAWSVQLLIMCEVLIGYYLILILIASVVSWVNSPLTPTVIKELTEIISQERKLTNPCSPLPP